MEQQEREIAAEFDDRAFEVAKFIQQLSKIQDDWLEELYKKAKEKGWFKGFEESTNALIDNEIQKRNHCTLEHWLFDYCYNGNLNQSFSEYCDSVMG
jgi:hypothetical protein